MKTFDLSCYLKEKREIIEGGFEDFLSGSSCASVSVLQKAMNYSLLAGGKRLRPILCLAAAETVGGDASICMNAAVALEMIHTYSLIHDDLPAMDDDDLRRGKKTCHVAFDEATAILAGDALLTMAFQIMTDPSALKDVSAESNLKVVNIISRAAGYQGMIEGQMRDMISEGKNLPMDQLQQLHSLKTGALIEASVTSGAILAGADQSTCERLSVYSRKIGLAFQVADDILNVEGDAKVMGKAVGSDEALNKATYPSLMGLAESKAFAEKLVNEALDALNIFDEKAEPLRAIAKYVIERKR